MKFYYVISILTPEISGIVRDLWPGLDPPQSYEVLRERLIRAFTPPEEIRAESLLHLSLGDRHPSALVGEIKRHLADSDLMFLIRHLFLRTLPPFVQADLRNTGEEDLHRLGQLADNVMVRVPSLNLAAAAAIPQRQEPVLPPPPKPCPKRFHSRSKCCLPRPGTPFQSWPPWRSTFIVSPTPSESVSEPSLLTTTCAGSTTSQRLVPLPSAVRRSSHPVPPPLYF